MTVTSEHEDKYFLVKYTIYQTMFFCYLTTPPTFRHALQRLWMPKPRLRVYL